MYGLRKYWCQVQDEQGNPVTSGITCQIESNAAYADAFQTALSSNPITNPTNGVVEFWTAATSVDVIISRTAGGGSARITLTPGSEKRVVLPQQSGPNILEQAMPPVEFFDDFLGGYVSGDRWTLATDAGGTMTIDDAQDGIGSLLSGATDNDASTLSSTDEIFEFQTDKNLFFEARVKCTEAAVNKANLFVGLSDIATVDLMQDDAAGPHATHNGAGFFKLDSNLYWEFETASGGAESELSDMLAYVSATWYRLGFKYDYNDGTTAKVTPYINGKPYAPCDLTIAEMSGDDMHVVCSIKAGSAAAETIKIDYVRVVADRDD